MTQLRFTEEEAMADRIFVGDDAIARLEALGMPLKPLRRALRAGVIERSTWSEAAPPAVPGVAAWGRINETWRLGLTPYGYEYSNPRGLPLTINPDGSLRFVATTGDGQTGREEGPDPATKYLKGVATSEAAAGPEQMSLELAWADYVDSRFSSEADAPDTRTLWILLYRMTEETPEGYLAELSEVKGVTPVGNDGRCTVDTFGDRIIIPRIEGFEGPPRGRRFQDGEGDDELDVPVELR